MQCNHYLCLWAMSMVCVCGQSAGPYMRALLSGSAVCSYCHNLNDAQAVALPYSASYRDNQCVMSTGDCLLILLALWIIYFIAPAHKSLLHLMVYTDFVTDVHQNNSGSINTVLLAWQECDSGHVQTTIAQRALEIKTDKHMTMSRRNVHLHTQNRHLPQLIESLFSTGATPEQAVNGTHCRPLPAESRPSEGRSKVASRQNSQG